MKRVLIAGGIIAVALSLVAIAVVRRSPARRSEAVPPSDDGTAEGFLYGRITTFEGATYEGRVRFGGGEEAFWNDVFNGVKRENPWVEQVPPERRPKEHRTLQVFGLKLGEGDHPLDLTRPFTAPFGEIARIESQGQAVQVTLKSGTVLHVNRFDASDFDDGVRVWDKTRGVVDLDSLRIRTIEFLPSPARGTPPARLHGTVRTKAGDFTGFIAWERDKGVGTDVLEGHTAESEVRIPLDTVRSIAPGIGDSSIATLTDGRTVELSWGASRRGPYVDDPRYGRVLIVPDAIERVDFDLQGSGPAYADFAPGRPLTGTVTTHDGRRLTGRIVFDLDESETTDTLDAPSGGIDYAVPFGMIASIEPVNGRVALANGEELKLEQRGDLGEKNAGMLIFVDDARAPEYVPWRDVLRVEFR